MTSNVINNNQAANLSPSRFVLKPTEMSALLEKMGHSRSDGQLFSDLPAPVEPLPASVLRANGSVSSEAQTIFETLLKPAWTLSITTFLPAAGQTLSSTLSGNQSSDNAVLWSREDDQWDMALLTERDHVVAILDDLVGLSDLETINTDVSYNLPVPAVLALGGISDLIREEEIQSLVNRQPASFATASQPIVVSDLVSVIEKGLQCADTRSAVTTLAVLSDGDFAGAGKSADVETGIGQLAALELVDGDGALTNTGLSLVVALRDPQSFSKFTVIQSNDGTPSIDRFGFIRNTNRLLQIVIGGIPGATTHCTIEDIVPSVALANLGQAIYKMPVKTTTKNNTVSQAITSGESPSLSQPKHCRHCGVKTVPSKRFCTACGGKVAA